MFLRSLVLSVAVACALVAMPVMGASGPPDLPTPTTTMMLDPMADAVVVAPSHDVCAFALVEDTTSCTITLAVVSGECPVIVGRVIGALGAAAIASPNFATACAGPPAPPE